VTGNRLLIVNSEEISAWISKGEVLPRYFNPGDVFDEVHLLLTNDDRPDAGALATMAGSARVQVHNLPTGPGFFRRSLGYRPALLRRWAREAVALASSLDPNVVRCHGADMNGFVAREIKQREAIPYVISLHTNPDVAPAETSGGIVEAARRRALARIAAEALRSADLVLAVYQPIVPFLERLGIMRYEVAYNMLSPETQRRKRDYEAGQPFEVVGVGRQIPGKRPGHLIEAVARTPGVRLTLIGDGPEHDSLVQLARSLGADDRVRFERAVPNVELCRRLADFDLFAGHSDYFELPKAVMEAMLAGLPVMVNRRSGTAVPELSDDVCLLVDPSVNGYTEGLAKIVGDRRDRERLGRAAADRADKLWSPEVSEERFADVYRSLLALGSVGPAAGQA
jgi:glycosyltransferase involved in cell wall biosynthesis